MFASIGLMACGVGKHSLREQGYAYRSKQRLVPINAKGVPFYTNDGETVKQMSDRYFWQTAKVTAEYSKKGDKYYRVQDANQHLIGYVKAKDLKKFELKYSAHRGYTVGAPDNSHLSIVNAAKNGFKSVEIDPRVTKDGKVVLMHDTNLQDTTTGTGVIEDHTKKSLNKIRLKDDGQLTKESIESLDDALSIAKKNGLMVNIDCSKMDWGKKSNYQPVMNSISKNKMFDNCFFVLSNQKQRDIFNKAYPEARLSWLYVDQDSDRDILERYRKYKNVIFSIPERAVEDRKQLIAKLEERGIQVHVYLVEDKAKINHLIKHHVSLVETNTVKP